MKTKIILAALGLFLVVSCSKNCEKCDAVAQRFIHKYGLEVSQDEWQERDKNGQIISTLNDSSVETKSYKNGVLHGMASLTFPKSNALKEKSEYIDGEIVKKTLFSFSGLPLREELYEEDSRTTITVWSSKGAPIFIEEYHGESLISGKYFSLKNQLESSIVNGKGERLKKNETGTLLSKDTFDKGSIVSRITYYPTGEVETISNFQDYDLHGPQKTFSPEGALVREANWENGELEGAEVCYRSGKIFIETPFYKGRKEGIEKEYNRNNQIVKEVHWKKDQKHGSERVYYKDFTDIQWFYNGVAVDLSRYNKLQMRDTMIADLEKSSDLKESKKAVK